MWQLRPVEADEVAAIVAHLDISETTARILWLRGRRTPEAASVFLDARDDLLPFMIAVDAPGTFFFYENWTSPGHLEAHLANSHLVEFAGKLDEYLQGGADGLVITQLQRIK